MSLLSKIGRAALKEAEELAVKRGAKRAAKATGNALDRVTSRLPAEALAVPRKADPLAVARKAPAKRQLALPAPPKVLALPAPGPGLPEHAAKPRGGQWWPDKEVNLGGYTANYSPENAVRGMLSGYDVNPALEPEGAALKEWFQRAVPKYIRNDLGAPDDPLRDLAARGLLHLPDLTAEGWSRTAAQALGDAPSIGEIMFPRNVRGGMRGAGNDLRGGALAAMPWLAKAPATDKLYEASPRTASTMGLRHVLDEMHNAVYADHYGIPSDLAVRPESLARMSFPQAVERVGKINQWRAKQAEQAALSNLNSPAIHTFKEYAENNPQGLRWVELKQPEAGPHLLDDLDTGLVDLAAKEGRQIDPAHMDEVYQSRARRKLEDALKYEGDTMGHCVGGYCDDVVSGRSRIFSLRDARGEPHVTVETAPRRFVFSDVRAAAGPEQADAWMDADVPLRRMGELAGLGDMQDIVQIKGKQNRAPKDDYLPFVQDFVKSGQWGNIGDLGNTGLVKLPDGRYITEQQRQEAHARIRAELPDINPTDATMFNWNGMAPYFEGYALGGRVTADRDFARHPMAVRRR